MRLYTKPLILAALLTLLPAAASAEVNPALAGQMVTQDIPGGELRREYARNGQLIYEVIEKRSNAGLEATEREWTTDGSPLREQVFQDGTQMRATFWYMNGQIKAEINYDANSRPVSERKFNASGTAGKTQEFFPDGSRRLP